MYKVDKKKNNICFKKSKSVWSENVYFNFVYILIDEVTTEEKLLLQQLSKGDYDGEYLLKKISMLQLHLDEAQKIIQAERRYVYYY